MTTIETAEPLTNDDLIAIDGRPARRRRKRRRIVPIAAIAVVLAAATGTAWAVLGNRNSAETTNLSCPSPADPHSGEVDPDGHAIIGVASGNPVVDCTTAWRKLTTAPPPDMVAYDNGDGVVVVLAEGTPVPEMYRALDPGTYQHTEVAALQRRLEDVATGLEAACLDFSSARQMAEKTLDELGLENWTVEQGRPGRIADGQRSCAAAGVDGSARTVTILGAGPQGDHPFGPFAVAVHDAVEASCLDIGEATAAVHRIASATTIHNGSISVDLAAPGVVDVDVVEDAQASCTQVTVTVGGKVSVTLDGPR